MWPFSSLQQHETKASRANSIVALGQLGKPVWSARDYANLASKGYANNPVVYRCVRMIAESVASVPLYVFESGAQLDMHPLLQLLHNPNPRQPATAFIEAMVGHLLIAGNAYIEAVKSDEGIAELYTLRPDRMRVIPGPEGWPQAYDYVAGGSTVRFRQDEGGVPPILHIMLFHPTNDHYGLAPLEAAAVPLDILNAAAAWNKALLDNSARPSGALVYAPASGATLSREQFERLKEELEQSFSGAGNAGRPLLLEGGLDWKTLSLSPRDMDFNETRNAAARDVALAFGVPPMLLGIPGDATYANYQEANRAFWRQTVLPTLNRITQSLVHWLQPAFGNVDLRYDTDALEALAAERSVIWERVGDAEFLDEDEKRAAVGYPPKNAQDSFKFDPNQPRVPAGNSGGGQWGGGSSGLPSIRDALANPRLDGTRLRTGRMPQDDSIRAFPSDKEIAYTIGALSAVAAPELRPALAALRRMLGSQSEADTSWTLGSHKSETTWNNQLQSRQWTNEQITETLAKGKQFETPNNVNKVNGATRYEYTGKFIVRDNKTKQILQVSGDRFKIKK